LSLTTFSSSSLSLSFIILPPFIHTTTPIHLPRHISPTLQQQQQRERTQINPLLWQTFFGWRLLPNEKGRWFLSAARPLFISTCRICRIPPPHHHHFHNTHTTPYSGAACDSTQLFPLWPAAHPSSPRAEPRPTRMRNTHAPPPSMLHPKHPFCVEDVLILCSNQHTFELVAGLTRPVSLQPPPPLFTDHGEGRMDLAATVGRLDLRRS
jgi:hypothetical protein